jgi:hypothetical protein
VAVDPRFCPYVGLQPFTEEDRAYFFGREREIRLVGANLYAASSRCSAVSGVGKLAAHGWSVPELREAAHRSRDLREWQRPGVSITKAAVARRRRWERRQAAQPRRRRTARRSVVAAGKGSAAPPRAARPVRSTSSTSPGGANAFDAELARAVVGATSTRASYLIRIHPSWIGSVRGSTVSRTATRSVICAADARDAIHKPLEQ